MTMPLFPRPTFLGIAIAVGSAGCGVNTLATVPPRTHGELDAMLGAARGKFSALEPSYEPLDLYLTSQDWEFVRDPSTGTLLRRQTELMVGYREQSGSCTWGLYRVVQESTGGGTWSAIAVDYWRTEHGNPRFLRHSAKCDEMNRSANP
jgi:hypothetical protein